MLKIGVGVESLLELYFWEEENAEFCVYYEEEEKERAYLG